MTNSDLLDRLVGDLRPVRRRGFVGDAAILLGLCAVELLMFLWLGMSRPDVDAAMMYPSFWWRLVSLGLIAACGAATAIASFNPLRSPGSGLRWVVALVLLTLAAGWVIDAVSADRSASVIARLDWRNGIECVWKMAVLSVPALIGLGVLMRRGAPTEPGGTALAVGVAAAAWGAFVFVFACPYDDPFYLAVWYSVGCGLIVGLARIVLPPLTRW